MAGFEPAIFSLPRRRSAAEPHQRGSWRPESNREPPVYETGALPVELRQRRWRLGGRRPAQTATPGALVGVPGVRALIEGNRRETLSKRAYRQSRR